jgi:hypothetical protein
VCSSDLLDRRAIAAALGAGQRERVGGPLAT